MPWSTRELAELTGTTLTTVRHCHRIGLLAEPDRAPNGYQRYRTEHVVRLLRRESDESAGLSDAERALLMLYSTVLDAPAMTAPRKLRAMPREPGGDPVRHAPRGRRRGHPATTGRGVRPDSAAPAREPPVADGRRHGQGARQAGRPARAGGVVQPRADRRTPSA